MVEQDPRLRADIIVEAPFEGGDSLGRSAMSGALTLDLNVDEVISSMELMLAIQEDLPYIEVKEEQVECLDAIQQARINGSERALIQLATGLGKTTVAAADAKRFLHENPGARVLFLSHQNRISDQARERFEAVLGDDYTFGNFTGEEQDFHEVDCLFASFQVMHNWREAFLESEFDYIIVDEAHHAKATTYEPTIEYFKPQFMLAMTATPDRHDLQDIRELFGPEIYKLTLEEAIARNLLSFVDYHVLLDEIAAEHVLRDPETRRKLSMKQLNRTVFIPKRDDEIAQICKDKEAELGEPVKRLVFCKSIEQTEELAQYYENAAPIHNNLPAWEIKQYLEKFKNGEISTLLTVDMFNEGIDVPDVNQVVFMRLTDSATIFLQQLGRGLRKLGGKEKVQVLDFVANCDRLSMLESFFRRIVDSAGGDQIDGQEAFRINGGEFHFSDSTREILTILGDIEANKEIFRNWAPDDSIQYYKRLASELQRLPSHADIKRNATVNGGPSTKLLTKHFNNSLSDLRDACGINPMQAQEGWIYVGSVAELIGITRKTVQNIAKSIGIEGTPMIGEANKIGTYFSDEEITRILEEYEATPFASEGWLPMLGMRKAYDIKPVALGTLAKQLGIKGAILRNSSGLKGKYFSPEEQAQIINLAAQTPPAPEDWKTAKSLARTGGLSEPSITKIAQKLHISGEARRSDTGKLWTYFSPDEQERILAVFNKIERAPNSGWTSMSEVRSMHSVHSRTIARVAKELGFRSKKMRNAKGLVSIYYTDDQWNAILGNIPEREEVESKPEDWFSMPELEELLGVAEATIIKMSNELGVSWEPRRNKRGHTVQSLSPEMADKLLTHQNVGVSIAPEGFMAVRGLSGALGISEAATKGMIKRLDLQPVRHKDPTSGNVYRYYSPDQIELMRAQEIVTASPPPTNYKSIYDIAATLEGAPSATVRGRLKRIALKFDIQPQRYKNPNAKRVIDYYSPEQVSLLLSKYSN